MSWILNNILNQKGSPAIYTDDLANRPAAGYTGRLFVAKDTFAWYRDNGTGWDLIGGPGSGTITGTLTAGRVAYATGSNTIATSANFTFDGTNDISINGVSIGSGGGNIATNVRIGQSALSVNTTGLENTAIGSNALAANNTGQANVAVGYNALQAATNASLHIAIGNRALEFLNNNSTGSVAIGAQALRYTTTGGGNNAVGNFAGILTTTGSYNQYFGRGAGYNVTTGSFNEIIGFDAAYRLTTGSYNICIGNNAGGNILASGLATGSENIFIGANTLPSSTSASNQIVIGYGAAATAADTVVIGNNNITDTYLKGNINVRNIVVTKNVSGIALSIVDTANGNAFRINKSGSGYAIEVANGISYFGGQIEQFAASGTYSTFSTNDVTSANNSGGGFYNIASSTQSARLAALWLDADGGNFSGSDYGIVQKIGGGALNIDNFQAGQPITISFANTERFRFTSDGKFGIGTNVPAAEFVLGTGTALINQNTNDMVNKLQVNGGALVTQLTTAAPIGGTAAAWKFGIYTAVTFPVNGYVELDINGTLYKLAATL